MTFLEALKKIDAFGLFHYEDCTRLFNDEKVCDCGLEKVEEVLYDALTKTKVQVDE